jgi:hypothetical protein
VWLAVAFRSPYHLEKSNPFSNPCREATHRGEAVDHVLDTRRRHRSAPRKIFVIERTDQLLGIFFAKRVSLTGW